MSDIIKKCVNAAIHHGEDNGDFMSAIGDLEIMLNLMWEKMTHAQKRAVLESGELEETLELGARGEFTAETLLQELSAEKTLDSEVLEIMEVNMPHVVGEYDVPDVVPEWDWIEKHASFTHRDNGKDGVWEFLVHVETVMTQADTIPEKLRKFFDQAQAQDRIWVMFYQ